MNGVSRFALCTSLTIAAALFVSGSHLKLTRAITGVSAAAAAAQDQEPDPAAVNQAPSGPSYTTQAPPPPGQEGAPGQGSDDSGYAEQPTQTALQPPPALPEYQQPPPPADGYIWTPGYWAWSSTGYYWVPGAWVEPPYMGALWTPGYWGYYGNRYMFYPGHWGQHIGFYGGINYGFGYIGFGYEGGYWNSGRFFYNRAYNHLNERLVHNVYSYNAGNRVRNLPRGNSNPRTSYSGGHGGVQARPQPSEGAAWHEPTAPRMNSQVQHAQSYGAVRGQHASQNRGNPARTAVSKPIPADRNVKPQSRGGSKPKSHQ